ncbi:hypothetical protein ACJMK2_036590 [Sinanodonta woodiana]|uniref:FERM domain-containing protein 8 n=1 Tax=Sinanodonta woodiana TaxID=1069815 RepID=A0ABD3WL84_SINWO
MAGQASDKKGQFIAQPSFDYSLNEESRLFDEGLDHGRLETSMDIVVFMRDRSGIHITIEEGQIAEAEELFGIVMEEQGLPEEYKDIFSLWLVSPLLELRLKRNHRPFYIVQQWDEFCSKYTDAKAQDITKDEPVLMFQRNVFFPKENEIEIDNEQVLGLLYHEAKYNVLEGRYILHSSDYHILAGIQALIQLGKYNSTDHVPATYRSVLHQYYPEHMYRRSSKPCLPFWSRAPPENCEEQLLESHQQITQVFDQVDIERNIAELYRRYLEVCRPYPFYGAAFFDCHIYKPQGKLSFLKRKENMECWTAISTDGVCVIEREKDEVLLAVPYVDLMWNYIEPQFDVDDDAFPCLMLQFLVVMEEEGGSEVTVTKLLQVFSRQAKHMDALIQSNVNRKKLASGKQGGDQVDGPVNLSDFASRVPNKLDKLCLQTFSTAGEALD